jgi:hypothetical protein
MLNALYMIVIMTAIQVFLMPYMMVNRMGDVYFSVSQGYMGAATGAAMAAIDSILWSLLVLELF